MRRFVLLSTALVAATLFSSCTDSITPLLPEDDGSSTQVPSEDISDGTTDGRPYFFFLNPFLQSKLKPNQVGTFDPTLEPTVTICLEDSWDTIAESCGPEGTEGTLVEYPFDQDGTGDGVELILSAEKYQVVYKSREHEMTAGPTYRVEVSIFGQTLGWADMAVYSPNEPTHEGYGPGEFTADDVLLLNGTENQNISFRIDEGALEAQFCDPNNVEDCDVLFVDPTLGGTLTVLDDADPNARALGAVVQVPRGILGPDGNPYTEKIPFVLELEFNSEPQPGSVPADRQYPYFIDLWTDVEGLYYNYVDENSPGVNITVCTEEDPEDPDQFLPEDLHDYLILFLVRTFTDPSGSTTTTTELLPTGAGVAECEALETELQTAAAETRGTGGFFSRVAAGFSRVTQLFMPQPLLAKRRLHGGLNTVVWEISKESKGGDAVAPEAAGGVQLAEPEPEPELLQLGAVLTVDSSNTSATVSYPDPGYVGETSTISVRVLDSNGLTFLFPVDVTIEVTGDNPSSAPLTVSYNETDSVYYATYTPVTDGTDSISVTLEKAPYLPETFIGTFESTIRLVKGPLAAQVVIENPDSAVVANGYPIQLYDDQGKLVGENVTADAVLNADGKAVATYSFDNITYGRDYIVHLAQRDFDVSFAQYTDTVPDFNKTSGPVSFAGVTQNLPETVEIFRLAWGGNGNAYEYTVGGRSWTAADNQVRDYLQLDIAGHLATITSEGENFFIAKIFTDNPDLCPNANQCKQKGWIGLFDQSFSEVDDYVWVTAPDEVYNYPDGFTGWPKDNKGIPVEPTDRKGNENYVEIDADGEWSITNGASTTNEGFFTEWDVPPIPGPFGDAT